MANCPIGGNLFELEARWAKVVERAAADVRRALAAKDEQTVWEVLSECRPPDLPLQSELGATGEFPMGRDAKKYVEWMERRREVWESRAAHTTIVQTRLAFQVPERRAVDIIERTVAGRVLELGAGFGLWAALLRLRGLDVTAVDNFSSHGTAKMEGFTTVVRQDVVEAVQRTPAHTMLVIWPPEDDRAFQQAFASFAGEQVIYVGEDDDSNLQSLGSEWVEVQRLELRHFLDHPSFLIRFSRGAEAWRVRAGQQFVNALRGCFCVVIAAAILVTLPYASVPETFGAVLAVLMIAQFRLVGRGLVVGGGIAASPFGRLG